MKYRLKNLDKNFIFFTYNKLKYLLYVIRNYNKNIILSYL
jgi:hypothetical protein